MKISSLLTAIVAAAVGLVAAEAARDTAGSNRLTAEEAAAGWKLLFDGTSAKGWIGMRGRPFPSKSWTIADGMIQTAADSSGGDIMYSQPFDDFELLFEWKINPGGNSGLKYLVQPEWLSPHFRPDMKPEQKQRQWLAAVGPEYQIFDDDKIRGKKDWELSATGSLYLLVRPENPKINAPGQWNASRIVMKGNHGEHWLNGAKILEFELGSKELLDRVAQTKFQKVPGYGLKGPGYIVLTHHNSPAWFRNLKIRRLQ